MNRKPILSALALLTMLFMLSGCSTLIQPVTTSGVPPTPVESVTLGGIENPDVYVDPAAFQDALLSAIAAGDREKLLEWMSDLFVTGDWRGEMRETPRAEALQDLFAGQLGAEPRLALVQGADLRALLSGSDPLAIPGAGTGVEAAALVSGWGQSGLDDAVLFIARQPDNSLQWRGVMRVKGGFSGARFGGVQAYQNEALGFSVYLPKDYQVYQGVENIISITAPPVEGAGHPGGASIEVQPADGRTAEEAALQVYRESKELMGEGGKVYIITERMGGETAHVVIGVPGQDMHRQMFIAHGDRLYRMWFYPDEPVYSPVSYGQMENIYAMITNTFAFLP